MSEYTTKKLMDEIESLPVDERIQIADFVLQTLTSTDPEVENEWIKVAERRLDELKSEKVQAIPGEEVFEDIRKRFSK